MDSRCEERVNTRNRRLGSGLPHTIGTNRTYASAFYSGGSEPQPFLATTVAVRGTPRAARSPRRGQTAEWIIQGVSAALPYFSPVTFTGLHRRLGARDPPPRTAQHRDQHHQRKSDNPRPRLRDHTDLCRVANHRRGRMGRVRGRSLLASSACNCSRLGALTQSSDCFGCHAAQLPKMPEPYFLDTVTRARPLLRSMRLTGPAWPGRAGA